MVVLRMNVGDGIIYWLVGRGTHHGETAKSGSRETVAIHAVLIGLIAGLLAVVEGDKEAKIETILFYALLSLFPLGALFAIQWLPRRRNSQEYAYDWSTVMMARWSLLGFAVLVGFVCYRAAIVGLPTQARQVPLSVSDPEDYTWKESYPDVGIQEKDAGVSAYVSFQPWKYDATGVPDPLILKVTLATETARSWQVGWVDGLQGDRKANKPKPVDFEEGEVGGEKWVWWHGLDVHAKYMLRVRLHQRNDVVSRQELKAKIRKDRYGVVKVIAYYPR